MPETRYDGVSKPLEWITAGFENDFDEREGYDVYVEWDEDEYGIDTMTVTITRVE